MKKESLLVKIWNTLWPLIIYSVAQTVTTAAGMLIITIIAEDQADALYYQYGVLFLAVAALICIPIYYRMYQKDCIKAGEEKKRIPMESKDLLAIILAGGTLAIVLNNVISITPLPRIFTGYEETNEILFGGGIILQILGAGIFGCITEELSFRGVTYLRMKRYWGKQKAMVLCAIAFGIYHLNVVQAVYAFGLGLLFAWVYERYDSLWAPIIAHMSANLFVILLGSTTFVVHILETMVGYCLLTCIFALIFYYSFRWMKQTNPLVELEFVEKEPDTLKRLAQEYKEQEKEGE